MVAITSFNFQTIAKKVQQTYPLGIVIQTSRLFVMEPMSCGNAFGSVSGLDNAGEKDGADSPMPVFI